MLKKRFLFLFIVIAFLPYCTSSPANTDQVRVRFPQDPETLNPVNYNNIYALQIIQLLFQSLLTRDLSDGNLKPLLASQLPQVAVTDSSALFTFQIRNEARWDNSTPITAKDVLFSLKVIKCPLVNNEKLRLRYEFIRDAYLDADNDKKITLVCDNYNTSINAIIGDFFILPAYLFDPEGLLQNFTLPELTTNFDSLSRHPSIKSFAAHFNSENFSHNTAYLKGSGGYLLEEWKAGESIKVKRKEKWWAEELSEQVTYITANPNEIVFKILPDNTSAVYALKNEAIDVYENVPVSQFLQLQQEERMAEKFTFFTPETYDFVYIGINTRLEKFADVSTRQAIAHLIDTDNIIKVTQENFATKTVAPINPNDSIHFNASVKPYTYSLDAAAKLLRKAGWQKEDGQWFKMIEEEKIPLTISMQYRAGNTEYENIALIFKQSASKLGIPVTLQPAESVTLTGNLKAHRFEMFVRGMAGSPNEYNFKPILHSESAVVDGMNYTGFGTAESDSLIDAINTTTVAEEKAIMLKRLQEIIREEASIIFLYNTKNRIIVNKRFRDLKISGIKPGSDVSAFQPNPDF